MLRQTLRLSLIILPLLFVGTNSTTSFSQTPTVKRRSPVSVQSSRGRQSTRASASPRQLVVSYQCEEAGKIIADQARYAALTIDELNQVTAVWESCANLLHNKNYPKDKRIAVVIPVSNSPKNPVEIKTVSQNDPGAIHQICRGAARAFFTYAEVVSTATPVTKAVVTGIDVVTDSGRTDCDSFIHAADNKNPLIVLAPAIISGSGVSMRILSMIGAGDSATKVQAAVDQLGKTVASSISQATNDVIQHPLIYATPQIINTPIGIPVVTPPPIPGVSDQAQSCVFHPWTGCIK